LEDWFLKNLEPEKYQYSPDSKEPPTDLQTCLRSKSRFEITHYKIQNRKVYKEKKTDHLWYVDNMHYGGSAHLEVFDKTGKRHLGEANLYGIIDYNKADSTKKTGI
jgi:hypothetical protein